MVPGNGFLVASLLGMTALLAPRSASASLLRAGLRLGQRRQLLHRRRSHVEAGPTLMAALVNPRVHRVAKVEHVAQETRPTGDAVRDASNGAKTGCFLSGGTDSSTLAGLLREMRWPRR